jgi:hypothetical protein
MDDPRIIHGTGRAAKPATRENDHTRLTPDELPIKNFQRGVTASRVIGPLHQRSQEIRGG